MSSVGFNRKDQDALCGELVKLSRRIVANKPGPKLDPDALQRLCWPPHQYQALQVIAAALPPVGMARQVRLSLDGRQCTVHFEK